jgi:hypothetical protein
MFGRLVQLIITILTIVINAIRSGTFWTYLVTSLRVAFGATFPAFAKLAAGWAVLYAAATGAIEAAILTSTKITKWVGALKDAGFPTAFDILLPFQYISGWAVAGTIGLQYTINWSLERLRRATRDEDRLSRPSVDQITVLFGRDLIPVETYEKWMHERALMTLKQMLCLDLSFPRC